MNIEQEIQIKQKHTHVIRLIVCVVVLVLFAAAAYVMITRPTQALTSPWAATNMTEIKSVGNRSCAIESGKVYCWGTGVLGNGTNGLSTMPVAVDTSTVLAGKTVVTIAMATNDTCALTSDGGVYCWGTNQYGGLGDGTTIPKLYPVAVNNSGVLAGKTVTSLQTTIIGSFYAIADGQLYGWGYNLTGALGDGSRVNRLAPVATDTTGVLDGEVITKVAADPNGVCVLTEGNDLACWGSNGNGEIGNGVVDGSAPVVSPSAVDQTDVLAGKTITALSRASNNVCVVADGAAYCWGYDSDGEIGTGIETNYKPTPTAVKANGALSGKVVSDIVTLPRTSCALTTDGGVFCWGRNDYGTRGDGISGSYSQPRSIVMSGALLGKQVEAIFKGNNSIYALSGGQLYSWGNNDKGILGIGTDTFAVTTPQTIGNGNPMYGKTITTIYVQDSASSVCALADGQPYCWGDNTKGQLGDGSIISSLAPVAVQMVTPELTSISQNGSLIDGSVQTMTLYGQDFQAGVSVKFGSTAAVITSSNATEITVEIPQPSINQATIVDVTVTSVLGFSSTLNDAFTFTIPAPVIDTISVSQMIAAPAALSQTVTINGSYFVSGMQVGFGNRSFAATLITSGQLEVVVTTPGVTTDETVDITVSNLDGASAVLSDAFTYLAYKPSLTSIDRAPSVYLTSTRVNETFTLTGQHFQSAVVTTNIAGSTYVVNSDTSLSVTLQTSAITQSTPVTVTVTNQYGAVATFTNAVTLHISKISSVNFSQVAQQKQLVITGASFPYDLATITEPLVTLNDVALPLCSTNFGVDATFVAQYLGVDVSLVSDSPNCYLIVDANQQPAFTATQVIVLLADDFDITARGKVAVGKSASFAFNVPVIVPAPPAPAVVPSSTVPVVKPSVPTQNPQTGTETSPAAITTVEQLIAAITVTSDGKKVTETPVLSNMPSFTGRAPAGSTVVITVRSDPITCQTVANDEGVWTCTLPETLPAGNHTVAVAVTTPEGVKTQLGPYSFSVAEIPAASSESDPASMIPQKFMPWIAAAAGVLLVIITIVIIATRRRHRA